MSTAPSSSTLSGNNAFGSLENSGEKKSAEKQSDSQNNPNPQKKPETRQDTRPRAGTWKLVTVPSQKSDEKGTEPMLSPRRANPASPASTATAKVATTPVATPTPQIISTSKPPVVPVPVASTTANPATVSNAVKSGNALASPRGYDKSRVDGDQIPEGLANALRAGFQGYKTVTDPKNSSKTLQVPVFNLPPKQIARLFVGLESNFNRASLSGEKMDKPLRDKFGIRNFRLNDHNVIAEINFIEHILKPFVEKEFSSEAFERVRLEVREKFNQFASVGNEILLETQPGKNAKEVTIKNLAFMSKFEPVIEPLINLICGQGRKLESSSLSRQFKEFLLEIDRSYSIWANAQGKAVSGGAPGTSSANVAAPDWAQAYALANVPTPLTATASENEQLKYQTELTEACHRAPEALFNLKKAALVGVMFNRALVENWVMKFHAESTDPQEAGKPWVKHSKKLNGCLGHYTSFKFDDLFIDVMASQTDQPAGFKEYLAPLKKLADMRRTEELVSAAKQSNKRKALERSSTVKRDEPAKDNRANLSGFFQGLISPRKEGRREEFKPEPSKTIPSTTALVRDAKKPQKVLKSSEGELLKNAEARKTQMNRRARKEMKDYLDQIKQHAFDLGYQAHMNNVITNRRNYEDFSFAPAAFCLAQLIKYRESLEVDGGMAPATIDKIEQVLTDLVAAEKQAAEKQAAELKAAEKKAAEKKAVEQALRTQSAKAAPAMPKLDLEALKKSPFAETDDKKEEIIKTSESTEKSDSTEVETEESEHAEAAQDKS